MREADDGGLGDRRVFERLPRQTVKPALALSLHTTRADLRAQLLPRAPRITPDELVAHGEAYARATGYPVQVQWTLLDGVNDGDDEIEGIVRLLSGKYAILNMIPFNTVEGMPYVRPSWEKAADTGRVVDVQTEMMRFTDQDRLEFQRAYYAGVSFMDAQVGRVLDAGPKSGHRVGERVFVPGARCFGEVRGLFGGAASRLVAPGQRVFKTDDPQLTTRRVAGPNPLRVVLDPRRRLGPHVGPPAAGGRAGAGLRAA